MDFGQGVSHVWTPISSVPRILCPHLLGVSSDWGPSGPIEFAFRLHARVPWVSGCWMVCCFIPAGGAGRIDPNAPSRFTRDKLPLFPSHQHDRLGGLPHESERMIAGYTSRTPALAETSSNEVWHSNQNTPWEKDSRLANDLSPIALCRLTGCGSQPKLGGV